MKDEIRFQFAWLKRASSRAERPVKTAKCSSGKSRGGTAAQEQSFLEPGKKKPEPGISSPTPGISQLEGPM